MDDIYNNTKHEYDWMGYKSKSNTVMFWHPIAIMDAGEEKYIRVLLSEKAVELLDYVKIASPALYEECISLLKDIHDIYQIQMKGFKPLPTFELRCLMKGTKEKVERAVEDFIMTTQKVADMKFEAKMDAEFKNFESALAEELATIIKKPTTSQNKCLTLWQRIKSGLSKS